MNIVSDDKRWTIYILKCKEGKYYVGKTKNLRHRIGEHFKTNISASKWTSTYPPISILQIIQNCDSYDEDKFTLKMMEKFGINNVRGGSFCLHNLSRAERTMIQKQMNSANDRCYYCNDTKHFAKSCQYRFFHLYGLKSLFKSLWSKNKK